VTKGNRMKKSIFLLYLHKAVERLRPRIEEGGYRYITEEHVELQTEINIMNFEKVAFVTDMHLNQNSFFNLIDTMTEHFRKHQKTFLSTRGFSVLGWSSAGLSDEIKTIRLKVIEITKENYINDPLQTDFIQLLTKLNSVKRVDLFVIFTDAEFSINIELPVHYKYRPLLRKCLFLVFNPDKSKVDYFKSKLGISKINILALDDSNQNDQI